ncbi:MAG: DNA cytosine methyltransferase [Pseudomonadota bacterium]
MAERLKFLEFFAGGGMARLGLARHFDCVFANDNDAEKAKSYRANFGESHLRLCDIAELTSADLPSADLAWASSPCQDVSLAGNRGGLTARRSSAFWPFWELMADLKREDRAPATIVLENVPGLLSSDQGRDLEAIVEAFVSLGYSCGLLDLNAQDFVPQSRRRVFLVCALGPVPNDIRTHSHDRSYGVTDASLTAVAGLPESLAHAWMRWALPAPKLQHVSLADLLERNLPAKAWRSDEDCNTLLAQMTQRHRERVEAARQLGNFQVGAVYRRVRQGKTRSEVRYDGVAGCLRTLKGGSSRQLLLISENGDLRLRGLTGREAARLMGLSDTYKIPETVTAATNLAGDGVCVPLVSWLAQHLLEPLTQSIRTFPAKRTEYASTEL